MKDENVLDAVKKMRPMMYEYKDGLDDGVTHFGFLAQDLEELFPKDEYGVVTEDPMGNLAVRYHEIIPMLVKYIHHLEQRVEQLEKSVED
jgi:hypothetical protein